MRAIAVERFGGPEVLTPVEIEQPSPISTELLVEVHAAGVNPVDFKTRRGEGVARWAGPPPFVPGWDVAGVVVSAGYGVTRFQPGDRVFGLPRFPRAAGAYAEYVTAPSLQLARIPPGLDFIQAAAMPLAALTAWQALVDAARLTAGQTVLVHGASGGVGHLAAQLVAALGSTVIATARRSSHEFLRALGVAELVDREAVPVGSAAEEADIVVDLVGEADTRSALGALRSGGVLLAVADGADEETKQEARRMGVRVMEPLVEPDGRGLDQIAALVEHGVLSVAVDRVLSLDAAPEAHRRLEEGGLRGKLVLAVRDG
ncbi:MAG: NADP-dependent oxidoreductase [Actinomycetota bacterium]|nr:NADP-dependent oxidoreductase [Actinomycetota bacterium]